MNLTHTPLANVYDIRTISSIPDFKYFFDTNVLKFVFARTFLKETGYQIIHYPSFFKALLVNKKTKFTFAQNFLELLGIIDFIDSNLLNKKIKDYRNENLEQYIATRKNIFDELRNSMNIFSIQIDEQQISTYFQISFSIDIKDYIYTLNLIDPEVCIVTDDFEFIYFENINLFTANRKIIKNARIAGKLIKV